jgi:CRISPR type IV-associated protein Csf2
MTIHNRIQGIIRLTSPLHCASPDKSLASATNETPTVQQYIVTARGNNKIPYFPGNDLRGRLRRKAAALVLDHITATSKVTPALYSGLTTGAITSSPESALTVEEALRARDNVYMGLFGGATRLLRSRYQVNDLIPVLAETIGAGMVPEKFGESDGENFTPIKNNATGEAAISGWQLVQTTQVLRVDDLQRVLRPEEIAAYIENAAEAVSAIQGKNLDSRSKRKASKDSADKGAIKKTEIEGKKETGNMMSFQSIMAGTPMYLLVNFDDDATDQHIGLMLLSLQALVREQKLGGWCRAGLGRFDATLTLTRGGETFPVFSANRASDDATLSKQTQAFVDAARLGISEQTETGLMEFFIPREKADAKEEAAA